MSSPRPEGFKTCAHCHRSKRAVGNFYTIKRKRAGGRVDESFEPNCIDCKKLKRKAKPKTEKTAAPGLRLTAAAEQTISPRSPSPEISGHHSTVHGDRISEFIVTNFLALASLRNKIIQTKTDRQQWHVRKFEEQD